jgi:hypothetical protein
MARISSPIESGNEKGVRYRENTPMLILNDFELCTGELLLPYPPRYAVVDSCCAEKTESRSAFEGRAREERNCA